MKKTHEAVTEGGSALSRYQDVIVGNTSLSFLVYFEICMWLSIFPGAIGIFLRKILWPRLFGSCGKGVVFAHNITIRHPKRIHIADNIVISEGCILDARNEKEGKALKISNGVILSNNVMLSCKNGTISIGSHTGVNAYSIIQSTNHCPVKIGQDVIIGPFCFITGGGKYNYDKLDIPIRLQGIQNDGGINIDKDVWLGGHVTVLGGVTVAQGTIVAAGGVVNKKLPAFSVCGGVPAKIIKNRT